MPEGSLAVFLCDAAVRTGGYRVGRCIALADCLAEWGWRCAFAMDVEASAELPDKLIARHEMRRLDNGALEDPTVLEGFWPEGADWFVVDDPKAGASFETHFRPWARSILVIEDGFGHAQGCDLLLALTPYEAAKDGTASEAWRGKRLSGPHYAPLPRRFLKLRAAAGFGQRQSGEVQRILVSLGPGELHGMTPRVLEAVARSGFGGAVDLWPGRDTEAGETLPAAEGDLPFELIRHPASASHADLIAGADLALGAADFLAWERSCLGLPSAVIALSEAQEATSAALGSAEASFALGRSDQVTLQGLTAAVARLLEDRSLRSALGTRAASLCDGRGALRVAMELDRPEATTQGAVVRLRPTTMDDADRILAWQRHPLTRVHFRNPAVPDERSHKAWLACKLADPGSCLSTVMLEQTPVGMVRLDASAGGGPDVPAFEVSILVDPRHHGQGIGKAALGLLRLLAPEAELQAEVLPENEGSHRLFRRAGYSLRQDRYYSDPVWE